MRKPSVLFLAVLLTLSLSAVAAESPRLLYSVPDHLQASELRMEIHVGGRLFAEDVLVLRDDARSGTFEFLQHDRDRLSTLARLDAQGKPAVVRISAGDELLHTSSLREYLASGNLLAALKPEIVRPLAERTTFGMDAGPVEPQRQITNPRVRTNTCEDDCETNRQWCMQNTPGCEFVVYCEPCENEYMTCLNYCYNTGDDDADGVQNSSDNCPGTANPGQQDCDGDGSGDACDSFNGTTTYMGYTETVDYVYGPVYSYCSGPWRYDMYQVYYHRTHTYRDTYCSGAVVNRTQTTYHSGYAWTSTYDPWNCGSYAQAPANEGAGATTDAQAPVLKYRDGAITIEERGNAHPLPVADGARFEQHHGALYLVKEDGAWQVDLDPQPLRKQTAVITPQR